MAVAVLEGIRVLDFSRILAGPYATRILADFGADVIKVQSKQTAGGTESNTGGYFCTWNRNKRSITLDMRHEEAVGLAKKLAAISDVVIENFSPRVMSNWGLNYKELKKVKPDLIMMSMSGMGQTGPWRNFVAFGSTVQSLGGLTYLTSYNKDSPVGPGYSHADTIAGLYAAFAVLASLDYREKTGKGQYIDLSEYEAVCTLIGPDLLNAAAGNPETLPSGNQSGYTLSVPHGCYKCRGGDRWCVIAVFNEREWQALSGVLGHPDWVGGPKFSTMSKRKENEKELNERLDRWTSKHSAEEIVKILQEAGVPAGIVQNAGDIANDPHLSERDCFVNLQHPILGQTIADRSPIRLGEGVTPVWKPAPLLGEDNRYVYMDVMGLTDQEFRSYVEKGIIA